MRTIAECAKLLKEDDPNTAITPNALRSMVLAGEIPHMRVGSKRLINYDGLLDMLHNPDNPVRSGKSGETDRADSIDITPSIGKVRRID